MRCSRLTLALIAAICFSPLLADDSSDLNRLWTWFRSQPETKQQQLRQTDAEFRQLPAATQTRYTRVLQNYNAWLARLPEAERKKIDDAATSDQRLAVVMDLKEKEWIASLPEAYRKEYVSLDAKTRIQRVKEWRVEEENRQAELTLVQRPPDQLAGRVKAFFTKAESKTAIESYVNNLKPSLSPAEVQALEDTRRGAEEHEQYLWYAIQLSKLSDQHPLLPGKVGPKSFQTIPDLDQKQLRLKKAGSNLTDEIRDLKKFEGRWPDYARELVKVCHKHAISLRAPLGDCRKSEMPLEVVEFLNKSLEPKLNREQADTLAKAEGKWPDYPRTLMDLARKHNLAVPGWTLPEGPEFWNKFRAGKLRPK